MGHHTWPYVIYFYIKCSYKNKARDSIQKEIRMTKRKTDRSSGTAKT